MGVFIAALRHVNGFDRGFKRFSRHLE